MRYYFYYYNSINLICRKDIEQTKSHKAAYKIYKSNIFIILVNYIKVKNVGLVYSYTLLYVSCFIV